MLNTKSAASFTYLHDQVLVFTTIITKTGTQLNPRKQVGTHEESKNKIDLRRYVYSQANKSSIS